MESGIAALESELPASIVQPDAGTVGQWLVPQVDEAYSTGRMPPMLKTGIAEGLKRNDLRFFYDTFPTLQARSPS